MNPTSNLRTRKRIPRSCRRCHRRKQRCVGSPACVNCELANQPCIRSDKSPSWHHRMSKGALVDQIETLEAQLSASVNGRSPGGVPSGERSPASSVMVEGHSSEETATLTASSEDNLNTTYLGPSSGLTIAENLTRIFPDVSWTKKEIPVHSIEPMGLPSPNRSEQDKTEVPGDETGSEILEAYFKNMHARLPFLNRTEILNLHARRHDFMSGDAAFSNHLEQFRMFKLFMVYAIGAAVRQMTESCKSTPPSMYHSTALQFDSTLRMSSSLSGIEARMLSVLYNLRFSSNSSVWIEVGIAMRICTDLGLHREPHYSCLNPSDAQRRRRLFWSVYVVERYVSWSLGRPFSIAEEEIDADIPADTDDPVKSGQIVPQAALVSSNYEETQVPNLRRFIAIIRLQRIMSQMRTRVYRLDRKPSTLVSEIEPLMTALEEYKRNIPTMTPDEDDFLRMHWNNCIRMLLQPFLSILQPENPLIETCLTASGQVCQFFKRLRQRDSSGHSFLLMNSVFMAGLTMCFCLWRSPHHWTTVAANDLRACSSALFVMAERNPNLKKYRDSLETVINRVMDHVNGASQHQPPTPSEGGNQTGVHLPDSTLYEMSPGLGDWLDMEFPNLADASNISVPGDPTGMQEPFNGIFTEDFWAGDPFILPAINGME